MKKLFTLMTLMLLAVGYASAQDATAYISRVISADGKTSTWSRAFDYTTLDANVNIPATGETHEGIVFLPSSNGQINFNKGGYLTCKSVSSIYIPVPEDGAGTIEMTVTSSSDSRYLQLQVNGADGPEAQRLWSKKGTDGSKTGPQSFEFAATDLTTYEGKTYLHLKDNNTELKIATFKVVLTAGSYAEGTDEPGDEPGDEETVYLIKGNVNGAPAADEVLANSGTAVTMTAYFAGASNKNVTANAKFSDGVLGTDLCSKSTKMRLDTAPSLDDVKGTPQADCVSYKVEVTEAVDLKVYYEAATGNRSVSLFNQADGETTTEAGEAGTDAMGGSNVGFVSTFNNVAPGTYTLFASGYGGGFMGASYTIAKAVEEPVEVAVPVFDPADGAEVTAGQYIKITTTEEDGVVYWTDKTYDDPFDVYSEDACMISFTAKAGDTVTFEAYTKKGDAESEHVTATYTVVDKILKDPELKWTLGDKAVTEFTVDINDEEAELPVLDMVAESGELSFATTDEEVASFDASEMKLMINGVGTATITATFAANDEFKAATAELKITVTDGETPKEEKEHTYDFTKWSEATVAALKADAAESKVAGWSDVEKKDDATADKEPAEAAKDNSFWMASKADVVDEDGNLTANGVVIEELKGLDFSVAPDTRNLAIAVNYPETSLGKYEGGAYLWLGGSGKDYFVMKGVKAGSYIRMGVESHKPEEARGVNLYVTEDGTTHGDQLKGADGEDVAAPKTFEEQVWMVPGEEGAVDVMVYNTNGCHIYYIDLLDELEEEEPGEASVEIVSAKVENLTDTTADVVVEIETANLPKDGKLVVNLASEADRAGVDAEDTTSPVKFELKELTAETEYWYVVSVTVYDAEGEILARDSENVKFTTAKTGIAEVGVDAEAARYFNLQGVEVTAPAAGQTYIKVVGNKAVKVLVK